MAHLGIAAKPAHSMLTTALHGPSGLRDVIHDVVGVSWACTLLLNNFHNHGRHLRAGRGLNARTGLLVHATSSMQCRLQEQLFWPPENDSWPVSEVGKPFNLIYRRVA